MTKDPIIAEIHRIRERLWRECHGSVEEMAEKLRRSQEEHPSQLIDPVKSKSRRRSDGKKP
jgi:hypothetical protein